VTHRADPTSGVRPWTLVAAMMAVQICGTLAHLAPAVIAVEAAGSLGVEPTAIGIFMVFVFLGAMISVVSAGAMTGTLGAIRVNQLGLLVSAAGCVLAAAGTIPAALGGAFLIGLGYGPTTPASSHLLARHAPPARRSLMFSVRQTGLPIGGVLTGLTIPALAQGVGWNGAMICVGALCMVMAGALLPLSALVPEERIPRTDLALHAIIWSPIRIVLSRAPMRRIAYLSFLFAIVQTSFSGYLVVAVSALTPLSLPAAGLILATAQGGGIGGRVFWGWTADRSGRGQRVLVLLGIAMALAALLFAQIDAQWPLWALCLIGALVGVTSTGWNGVYLSELARHAPAGRIGEATGGALLLTYCGSLFGPLLFGGLISWVGDIGQAFAVLGLFTLLAILAGQLRRS
jgi:MFS family permease